MLVFRLVLWGRGFDNVCMYRVSMGLFKVLNERLFGLGVSE